MNGLSRSNKDGSVTVAARLWVEQSTLAFDVSMDAHSGDLSVYDIKELATLRDSGGSEYRPASWDSAPGGHHRNGKLTFGPFAPEVASETTYVELVVRDVAGVKERVLRWELG